MIQRMIQRSFHGRHDSRITAVCGRVHSGSPLSANDPLNARNSDARCSDADGLRWIATRSTMIHHEIYATIETLESLDILGLAPHHIDP